MLVYCLAYSEELWSYPSFWDSVELSDELGGVYAHVAYDPSRS